MPFFSIGLLVVYLISCWRRIADDWRWPVRIIGYAIVVIITTFIINPWMRVEALNFSVADKGVDIKLVNTGVFPLSDEQGGRFFAGQVKTVNTQQLDEKGRFIYIPRPSLGFWGVVFVVIWCLAPMFMAMIVKIPATEEFKNLSPDQAREEKNRNLIIFIATLVISILITAFQVSSLAAFAAVITNTNSAQNNDYFTCTEAHSNRSNPRPFFAYALERVNVSDSDTSGNGRHGQRTGNFKTATSSGACVRDSVRTALQFSDRERTCVAYPQLISNPNTFSLEIWFKTSVRDNSKMIGFGAEQGGGGHFVESGGAYSDRHVYIHNGVIHFGLYPNRLVILRSPQGKNYADNNWHHLIVTTSPNNGTKMYVDGALVASNNSGGGQNYRGYWKIGCGRMGGWQGATGGAYQGGRYYTGDLRQAAIYDVVLSEQQVKARFLAGARP